MVSYLDIQAEQHYDLRMRKLRRPGSRLRFEWYMRAIGAYLPF